jgi:flagellar motility protein MotE (MotC chaperone)
MLAMLVRVEDAHQSAKNGLFITTSIVQAEEKSKDDAHKDEPKKDDKKDAKKDDKKSDSPKDKQHAEEEPAPPKDPLSIEGQEMRPSTEITILQDLADRRQEIEAKEIMLNEREAMLKASEMQFEAKLKELTGLRNEIKALVDAANAKEDAETKRIIAIYEKMKPKDAAGIFDTLSMDILLPIARGMKEAKLSPILAAMSGDKAKLLTGLMSQKTKVLPDDAPVRAVAQEAAKAALPPLPPPAPPEQVPAMVP